MNDGTNAVFSTLREVIKRWSISAGHQDAYVRGSQARRNIAEQIVRYRAYFGRQEFIKLLRQSLAKSPKSK